MERLAAEDGVVLAQLPTKCSRRESRLACSDK
jgi:hypothetical protein